MQEKAKQLVAKYFNEHVGPSINTLIIPEDVYIPWFSKTLKNWKCTAATPVNDGMYYEITHNGCTGETYIDVYKKVENLCIKD